MPGRRPLPGGGRQRLQFRLIVRRADMLDIPRPAREDHTTWTAVAPDEVFTVRTYATARDYEPRPSAQIC
jgi:hypothetical protein